MRKNMIKRRKWVFLDTTDEFEKFLSDLDQELEAKVDFKKDTFNDWVNHYYKHLLKELGPSNGWLFS